MRAPRFSEPGHHTAYGGVLEYRLRKLEARGLIAGDWLDVGCADGFYVEALWQRGARSVVGVDPMPEIFDVATRPSHGPNVSYVHGRGEDLPFEDEQFDGVLLNEVLEHVNDDFATLVEARRVLRPHGRIAIFSPNRWFPFEGHGARWSERRSLWPRPVPLMPWLPLRWTSRFATARNYWPSDLERLVSAAGFDVEERGWALALFEQYQWIPATLARLYRRHLTRLEESPIARFLAVSTFIVARR